MPDCGEAPDEMPNAIASGSATKPTVTPARQSRANVFVSYVRSVSNSRGRRELTARTMPEVSSGGHPRWMAGASAAGDRGPRLAPFARPACGGALLDAADDERRPAGLVRGAEAAAVVAVEILVEQHQVA